MNGRNFKHLTGKKSPSPYPERRKRPRLKFSWRKEQNIDYDKSKQIDIFIQDVIDKAKEDYLKTYCEAKEFYTENNSHDKLDGSTSSFDDKNTKTQQSMYTEQEMDVHSGTTWSGKSEEAYNGSIQPGNIEMTEIGKDLQHGERKPLIERSRRSHCCSNENICVRLMTIITCYHCCCLRDIHSER